MTELPRVVCRSDLGFYLEAWTCTAQNANTLMAMYPELALLKVEGDIAFLSDVKDKGCLSEIAVKDSGRRYPFPTLTFSEP